MDARVFLLTKFPNKDKGMRIKTIIHSQNKNQKQFLKKKHIKKSILKSQKNYQYFLL